MRLYGVLVTFERPADLRRTLGELAKQSRRLDGLVVVDNGTTEDGRLAVGEGRAASVEAPTYVRTGANLGPAGGIKVGFEDLVEGFGDDDWVVLLDDDNAPPSQQTLEQLGEFAARCVASDPRTGVVGLVGADSDGRKGRLRRVPDSRLAGAVAVDYIGGGQMLMVRGVTLKHVGGFDPDLFFGFDDLEFCLRVKNQGWSVYADGDAWLRLRGRMQRLGITESPRRLVSEPSWRNYYSQRNLIHILREEQRTWGAVRVSARGIMKPLASLPVRPRDSLHRLWLAGWGTVDGWSGRLGRTLNPAPMEAVRFRRPAAVESGA